MFTAILGPVASLAKTWIEGKQKKSTAQITSGINKIRGYKNKNRKRWFLGR